MAGLLKVMNLILDMLEAGECCNLCPDIMIDPFNARR